MDREESIKEKLKELIDEMEELYLIYRIKQSKI